MSRWIYYCAFRRQVWSQAHVPGVQPPTWCCRSWGSPRQQYLHADWFKISCRLLPTGRLYATIFQQLSYIHQSSNRWVIYNNLPPGSLYTTNFHRYVIYKNLPTRRLITTVFQQVGYIQQSFNRYVIYNNPSTGRLCTTIFQQVGYLHQSFNR